MTDEAHVRWEESLGAFALGALPDDESREVEEHVGDCAACRRELAELRVAVDALPASAPLVEPPAELRRRIMDVVESEAELLSAAGAGADRPRAQRRGPRAWFPRPVAATLVAAAVLGAGIGVGAALFTGGSSGPAARTVEAQRTPSATTAAYLRLLDGRANLVVRGMPAPPPGRVYEVWVQRAGGGAPRPAGAMFALRAGTVALPRHVGRGERVLVTAEPRGGSATPTSAPVIVTGTT
jgi:anti-sigma-K factor RskA